MVSEDREYRAFEMRASEEGMTVEGYAAVFNSAAILYSLDGIDYKEEIDRNAFNSAQMADVVMNYNHQGKPVARTKNGTLELFIDNTGLRIKANLAGTEEGRRLYEEIKGGYIDKMSFAFIVSEDSYDRNTHTRRILGFDRIFDVAAVDMPAYDATSISARSYFSAEAEKAKMAEARAKKIKKIKLMLEV
ncbi:HK97 family phage prohead protease [Christensenella massiliensis]|uniref:HK97 family phage prohead protease n=1 Tax=Christensenella massiliensis TaxID=1805714 RepID=A0AAU8ACE1_9FIRM